MLNNTAVLHDPDLVPVGNALQLVGDHQGGLLQGGGVKRFHYALLAVCVKAGCGLVQQHKLAWVKQRAGNGPFLMGEMMTVPDIILAHCLTWALSEHFEINASYVKIDIVDTPEVDLTTSTRARLVGEFDGGADLYGVSMQYRF